MEKQKITLSLTQKGVTVKNKKKTDEKQLEVFKTVKIADTWKRERLNEIGLSTNDYESLSNCGIFLFDEKTKNYLEVSAVPADLPDGKIKITRFIKERFCLGKDGNITLLKNKAKLFFNFQAQRVDDVKSDSIAISRGDFEKLKAQISAYRLIKLTNANTGESYILKSNHLKIDEELESGHMLLSRKQRIFLGLELPKYLSKKNGETIAERLKKSADEKELALFEKAYGERELILNKSLTHDEQEGVKKLIKKFLPPKVILMPVIESFHFLNNKRLKKLSDFFVGKSTMNLICRRPYESDEGADVVRMTKSNMELLGVESMDRVILKYKNTYVSCQVLELADNDLFFTANLPVDVNHAVGIPAHVRKKLGVYGLNCAVKVDRDTGFIFRKSLNEQIVPIVLTLFSLNVFNDADIWHKTLLSLISVPVVVFFNLSSKRTKRGLK